MGILPKNLFLKKITHCFSYTYKSILGNLPKIGLSASQTSPTRRLNSRRFQVVYPYFATRRTGPRIPAGSGCKLAMS